MNNRSVEFLRTYDAYRRGEPWPVEDLPSPTREEIGEAIDWACDEISAWRSLAARYECSSRLELWKMLAGYSESSDAKLRDEIARLQAQRDELLALLTDARKWQAEGEYGDPLPPDCWSPDYAAFMRKLDAAIATMVKT